MVDRIPSTRYLIPRIERGPEPERQPSWEELLVEDVGRLSGPNFSDWASRDMGMALDMLGGFIDALPAERRPKTLEEALGLIDWTTPQARDEFRTAADKFLAEQEDSDGGQL